MKSTLSRSRSERERCCHRSSKGGCHQKMGTSQGCKILSGISRNSRLLHQYLLEVAPRSETTDSTGKQIQGLGIQNRRTDRITQAERWPCVFSDARITGLQSTVYLRYGFKSCRSWCGSLADTRSRRKSHSLVLQNSRTTRA